MMSYVDEDNKILEKELIKIEGFIKINRHIRRRKFFIFDRDELPFVQTDEGDNYYGLEGVRDFVSRELLRKKSI